MEYLGRVGSEVRAIVLTGTGKHFSAGIDVASVAEKFSQAKEIEDPARASIAIHEQFKPLQENINSIDRVRIPVIAALHGLVIGGGMDLASICDIRIASQNAKFSIREIDLGFPTDIGAIHFQKAVGNQSWMRELAYSTRMFTSQEALKNGLISKIVDTPENCLKESINLAILIASKSPIAVATTKSNLNYSRDHSVQEGLDHIAWLNSVMLQTDDLKVATIANMQK